MKTPAATEITTSAPNSLKFTPRQARVCDALLLATGWVWREDIDRIAGASNGPQVILQIRRKFTGDDGLEMERVDVTDRDGLSCRPGRYRLTEIGRQRILRAGGICG